jgi:GxxExxY protein
LKGLKGLADLKQFIMEFKYGDITKKIIGASMKVHSQLGNGFQEVIYQRALEIQLAEDAVVFSREFNMPIFYNGQQIGERRVDFLIEDKICVELKAIEKIEPVHFAQAKE